MSTPDLDDALDVDADELERRIRRALVLLDRWPRYAHRGDSGSKSLRRDVRLALLGEPDGDPPDEHDVVVVDDQRWRYVRAEGGWIPA